MLSLAQTQFYPADSHNFTLKEIRKPAWFYFSFLKAETKNYSVRGNLTSSRYSSRHTFGFFDYFELFSPNSSEGETSSLTALEIEVLFI